MSSEKKSVLVRLLVSAAIVVALYCSFFFVKMSDYAVAICLIFFCVTFLYALARAEEFLFLKKEPEILVDYDAAHPSRTIPPTRIAAIVERQRRDMARFS
jgi:hypothetical protein